ncbi:MAG: SDR family oxidoreductase [Candidatus Aminicenantes bacterium]|nr:SDR family oxidoreductase [Candidatus Aminicenantes bacterium]
MTNLLGKIVFITGASSGIGLACARAFAAQGAKILLAARRLDRLRTLSGELEKTFGVPVLAFSLDVRNQPDVERAVRELPPEWEAIDILVNNAGLSRGLDKLHEGSVPDWEEMIDTNVKGLLYVSRAVLPGMVRRGSGHVINIGSIAGQETYPGGNVYCATKFAVRALSQGLRMDLLGTAIRVSSVDPGMVETEFSLVRYRGDAERARKVYEGLTPLLPEDVAEAAVFCATRPPRVDVANIVLMPTDQASALLSSRRPKS